MILWDGLVCRVNFIHVTMSTGGRIRRPCITALWPWSCHLWGRNHYFSKGAVGLFVWCGPRVLYGACGRMLRARWSVYACECECTLLCMWHGRGTSVKGPPGQTFGCPWQCTPGGAGLVQGPLRVLHSPGQKLGPSWKMWIQWLLCPKPRDMPSEKSDLCWESDCVFEPLLLSLAVRGKEWLSAWEEMEWVIAGVGWRSVLTGGVYRWGGVGGGVTQEERHGAVLLHLTLNTTN